MPETSTSTRLRPRPVDTRTRLLLDPYICVGPGSEAHADTLFAVSQYCAALGIMLCVERQAWLDAARDPDVVRRRVDLSRLEPLCKLDALPVPSNRDAGALFVAARSETDVADLKLLGALHARVTDQLLALDGRLHSLAARAGLSSRVLTPADALHWLASLAGDGEPVLLREIDPRETAGPGPLRELLRDECEPFDPYLRDRLAAGHGRALASYGEGGPLGLGIVDAAPNRFELVALAARDSVRSARVLEPIVGAALAMARRRGVVLDALLPPHEEMVLGLLEDLGFQRLGHDPHGRVRLRHALEGIPASLADAQSAWVLPLDAAGHDYLLPELSGAGQAQLFAVGADSRPQTLGSPLRKQIMLPAAAQQPSAGDLLLFFHARSPRRPASASLTCVARVERLQECTGLEDVLVLNASRPGYSLAEIQSRLADGPVAVLDVVMLGRLERFLPLSWLKEQDVLPGTPRALRRLAADAWERLCSRLALA